jgi:hypothetical protein
MFASGFLQPVFGTNLCLPLHFGVIYLSELERMPQRMMWNSVSLTVEKYPRNVMVLRVYTLSLDRNWLVV